MQGVFEEMRKEGALCIADEVQTGFGRLGSAFWAFQTQGVVPDIVTAAKAAGNGFPLGVLIAKPALTKVFANGMEYFNTTGGSNAAAAAGLAVLRSLRDERLVHNAAAVGAHLLAALKAATEGFEVIGDVRGCGLFVGLEVVRDRASKQHAPRCVAPPFLRRIATFAAAVAWLRHADAGGELLSSCWQCLLPCAPGNARWATFAHLLRPNHCGIRRIDLLERTYSMTFFHLIMLSYGCLPCRLATWLKEAMLRHRFLLSTDGPYDNILKLKPPMCFTAQNADDVAAALRLVLSEELTPEVVAAIAVEEEAHRAAVVLPRMAKYQENAAALAAAAAARRPRCDWNTAAA